MEIGERLGRLLRPIRAGERHSAVAPLCRGIAPTLMVTSPAFVEDGEIPIRYRGRGVGENLSPTLHLSGIPAGTKRLLFVVEDPDVPLPRPILHCVTQGGVDTEWLEGSLAGYHGPRPLPGHGPHRYGFYVFALDEDEWPLPRRFRLHPILETAQGHVLAWGVLHGIAEATAVRPGRRHDL